MITEGKNIIKNENDEKVALTLKQTVFKVYYTTEIEQNHDLAGIHKQEATKK